jgi:hypothetical protein
MSTSLQTDFAAFMHLAEGQILCVMESMGESDVTDWNTECSVVQKG